VCLCACVPVCLCACTIRISTMEFPGKQELPELRSDPDHFE